MAEYQVLGARLPGTEILLLFGCECIDFDSHRHKLEARDIFIDVRRDRIDLRLHYVRSMTPSSLASANHVFVENRAKPRLWTHQYNELLLEHVNFIL